MKILVTGGAGYIGSVTSEQLLDRARMPRRRRLMREPVGIAAARALTRDFVHVLHRERQPGEQAPKARRDMLRGDAHCAVTAISGLPLGKARKQDRIEHRMRQGHRPACARAPAAAGASGAFACSSPGAGPDQYRATPLGGDFNLNLMAPVGGAAGALRIGADVPDWLEFDWSGAGNQDPSGVATFGRFRGHDRIIFWRESP